MRVVIHVKKTLSSSKKIVDQNFEKEVEFLSGFHKGLMWITVDNFELNSLDRDIDEVVIRISGLQDR